MKAPRAQQHTGPDVHERKSTDRQHTTVVQILRETVALDLPPGNAKTQGHAAHGEGRERSAAFCLGPNLDEDAKRQQRGTRGGGGFAVDILFRSDVDTRRKGPQKKNLLPLVSGTQGGARDHCQLSDATQAFASVVTSADKGRKRRPLLPSQWDLGSWLHLVCTRFILWDQLMSGSGGQTPTLLTESGAVADADNNTRN